ncbi:uncharacterized protein B0P05DRAFT_472701, partial [Gilbertella persicaria]|uniref:uncharacterized protein n=1 Tax=Gilbertella persicaria TaxID=101096 RepID=UPI00221F79DE
GIPRKHKVKPDRPIAKHERVSRDLVVRPCLTETHSGLTHIKLPFVHLLIAFPFFSSTEQGCSKCLKQTMQV